MGSGLAVSLVVSLVMSAVNAGLSIRSLAIASKNQALRSVISSLMNAVNKEINAGRLNVNKITALLQSKNQSALMNYLQNNPVISRNLQGLKQDSDFIAQVQAEQSAIESEINSLYNELQSLGYSQDLWGQGKEDQRRKLIEGQLTKAKDKYKQLGDKASKYSISTTNPVEAYTDDIDARSQNINGGMQNGI